MLLWVHLHIGQPFGNCGKAAPGRARDRYGNPSPISEFKTSLLGFDKSSVQFFFTIRSSPSETNALMYDRQLLVGSSSARRRLPRLAATRSVMATPNGDGRLLFCIAALLGDCSLFYGSIKHFETKCMASKTKYSSDLPAKLADDVRVLSLFSWKTL